MAGPAGSGPRPGPPRAPRPPGAPDPGVARPPGARPLGIARPPGVLSLAIEGAARGGGEVLGPVRLEIAAGETVALAGPSGIGKTTLLRIVAGLDAPRGTLKAPIRRALIFQEPTLLPWRTARANLCIAARVDAREADAWLDRVGLGGLGGRYPMSLSLGQQRRLSLARAFASRPDLLLMDEPFVSLDAAAAAAMMDLFEGLRRGSGAATLLVTHSLEEARRLADRVLTLGGRPAVIVETREVATSEVGTNEGGARRGEAQNMGRYRHSSASGVASPGS